MYRLNSDILKIGQTYYTYEWDCGEEIRRMRIINSGGMPHINIAFLHQTMIIVVVTIIYPITELEMKMF